MYTHMKDRYTFMPNENEQRRKKTQQTTINCTQYGLNWSKNEMVDERKDKTNAKVIIESREYSAYLYKYSICEWKCIENEESVGCKRSRLQFYVCNAHKVLCTMHNALTHI